MLNTKILRLTGSLCISLCLGIVYYAASFLEPSGFSIYVLLVAFLLIYLMWEGVHLLSSKLDNYYPWGASIRKRLTLQVLLGSIYALILVNIPYNIYKFHSLKYYEKPGSEYSIHVVLLINGLTLMLFLVISGLQLFAHFLDKWQRAELIAERAKKESLQARLETLKTQVNPHFLFNNLNILSFLIDKSQQGAKEFLDRFAQVYRYVLNSRDKELISLSEELICIESYIFLLKERFEDSLQIQLYVSQGKQDRYIPPLCLQLLIENAIKHNIVSSRKPLLISISIDKEENLVVSNTLQERNTPKKGTGIGLSNIAKRYEYLSDKRISIEQSQGLFIVKLPLLELETI